MERFPLTPQKRGRGQIPVKELKNELGKGLYVVNGQMMIIW